MIPDLLRYKKLKAKGKVAMLGKSLAADGSIQYTLTTNRLDSDTGDVLDQNVAGPITLAEIDDQIAALIAQSKELNNFRADLVALP